MGGQGCTMPDTDGSSSLHSRSAAGLSWACQQSWCCLCEKTFKKGQNNQRTVRNEERSMRSNPVNTRAGEEGSRVSQAQSRDSPAAHGEDHSKAACPCSPWRGQYWSRYPLCSLSCTGPHTRAGGYPLKELQPLESPAFPDMNCGLQEGPSVEHRKVWGGRSSRRELLRIYCNLCWPSPCNPEEEEEWEELGMKEWRWAWKKTGDDGKVSEFFVIVFQYPNQFQLSIN